MMLSDPYYESEYIPEVGDKVIVKSRVPLYGGRVGHVTAVDVYGTVTVHFQSGDECSFDSDDLRRIEE